MKNSIIITIFLFLSQIGFTQTFEETSRWIENNAGAPNSLFSNSIAYNAQAKKLLFYKNYSAPFKFRKVIEIDPKDVSSISLYEPSILGGLKAILINFKTEGSNAKIYLVNNDSKISKVNKVEEAKMKVLPILAEGNLDHAKRIKLYYINLFQQLGVSVKDVDTF